MSGSGSRSTYRISIHALREEGDVSSHGSASQLFTFLSTPSARRATCIYCRATKFHGISIHALREEGDTRGNNDVKPYLKFLSTPSARRATRHPCRGSQ